MSDDLGEPPRRSGLFAFRLLSFEIDISSCPVQATLAFSVLWNQFIVPANYSIPKINYVSRHAHFHDKVCT